MKEERNENEKTNLRLVLRFTPSGKVYSLLMPLSWTVKKLKSFICYSFKDDVKNSLVNLYSGAKLLKDENLLVANLFNMNREREELNQIIVNLKSKEMEATNTNSEAAREKIVKFQILKCIS